MNINTDESASIGHDLNVGGRLTARGNATFTRNVRIGGWLDAPNLKSPCQGMYSSFEALLEAHPNPAAGWWALVPDDADTGGKVSATIYTAAGGEWQASGSLPLDIDIDLDTKADKSAFVTISEGDYDGLDYHDPDTYYFIYED